MLTDHFYDILDNELEEIINEYQEDETFQKRHSIEQKKSYAFLVWFIKLYNQGKFNKDNITDGDDDNSCDIIFSKRDSLGNKVFYVIQSKWNNKRKSSGKIDANDIRSALNNFDTLLNGSAKRGQNERFNQWYAELLEHLKKEGLAKFIFLALAHHNDKVEANISHFKKNYAPSIGIEVVDIDRLKCDFIDFRSKGFEFNELLVHHANPEESKITLKIERTFSEDQHAIVKTGIGGDYLKINHPYEAYIFLLKPRVIQELFKTFGFSLFAKNVRNPLPHSNYNAQIVQTLHKKPAEFWYFNNGISAITKIMPTGIGPQAEEIRLTGLQIINGAQTVFSVYSAYEEATPTEREVMDLEARITFRVIKSNNEDFNLEITRYTNSQNPIFDRDFQANDEIQVRLQKESFQTAVWYEKRRGEFRNVGVVPSCIKKYSNELFARTYLAYQLADPIHAQDTEALIFLSRLENKQGLYEKIFNEDTKFDNMRVSFYLYKLLNERYLEVITEKSDNEEQGLLVGLQESNEIESQINGDDEVSFHQVVRAFDFHLLALFRIIYQKYTRKKFSAEPNLALDLQKHFDKGETDTFKKIFLFIGNQLDEALKVVGDSEKTINRLNQFKKSHDYFLTIKFKFEDMEISLEDIDNLNLTEHQTVLSHYGFKVR